MKKLDLYEKKLLELLSTNQPDISNKIRKYEIFKITKLYEQAIGKRIVCEKIDLIELNDVIWQARPHAPKRLIGYILLNKSNNDYIFKYSSIGTKLAKKDGFSGIMGFGAPEADELHYYKSLFPTFSGKLSTREDLKLIQKNMSRVPTDDYFLVSPREIAFIGDEILDKNFNYKE